MPSSRTQKLSFLASWRFSCINRFPKKNHGIFGEGFFTKKTNIIQASGFLFGGVACSMVETSLLSLSQPRPTTPPRPKSHRAGFRPGFFCRWSLGLAAKWKAPINGKIFLVPPLAQNMDLFGIFIIYIYIYMCIIPIPAL